MLCSQRERQVQREETQELTEKLDQEWRSIQALMVKNIPKSEREDKPEEKPKVGTQISFTTTNSRLGFPSSLLPLCLSQMEEYDMIVRELGFEMKAQPSEKMKSPEALAKEEKEKLQKLEVRVLKCYLLLSFFTTFFILALISIHPQADRLRRMMGDEVQDSTQRQIHISADDLNDGFVLDKLDKKSLSYQARDRSKKKALFCSLMLNFCNC